MATSLVAYDLPRIVDNPDYFSAELRTGMEAAPVYERFADAGRHVIRTIHSIPTLLEDAPLSQVEVYVGRAGATPRHVQSRWRHHFNEKKHDHGAIVLRCSTDVVDIWETAAVRAIKGLEPRGRLCVRNASASGQGSLPSTTNSVIYVTRATKQRRDITLADKRMIDEVAREVAEHTKDLGVQVESLRRALDPITRPVHERADIEWHSCTTARTATILSKRWTSLRTGGATRAGWGPTLREPDRSDGAHRRVDPSARDTR